MTFHRGIASNRDWVAYTWAEIEVRAEKVAGGEAVGDSARCYERACSCWPRQDLPDTASGAEVETAVVEGELRGEVEVDRNRVWPSVSGRVQLS